MKDEHDSRQWVLDMAALGAVGCAAALALAFCSGCSTLSYVKRNPIEAPSVLQDMPPLTVPALTADACPAFRFEDEQGGWVGARWDQPGVLLDTVEVGDDHPAVKNDEVWCSHVVIPASWWVTAREARDRVVPLQNQIVEWQAYSVRAAERHQQESEEIAELLKMSKKRQIEMFLFGTGAGAGAVTILLLALVLGGGGS